MLLESGDTISSSSLKGEKLKSKGINISSSSKGVVVDRSRQRGPPLDAMPPSENENYQYVYRYSSQPASDDNGTSSSHLHESPLDHILNVMKQKYGNATGAGATLFDTSDIALPVSYLSPGTVVKSTARHHMPPEQHKHDNGRGLFVEGIESLSQTDTQKSSKSDIPCSACAGKRHFDPLGEMFYCHRANHLKQHINISVHDQFRSLLLRTNSARLIHCTVPSEIDSLLRHNGHVLIKRNFPHEIIQNFAVQIGRKDGRVKRKFCFSSSTSTGNRQAFQVVEDKAAAELAHYIGVLSHEMALEEFAAAENDAFKEIFKLIHSTDPIKRIAGVRAVDALILVPSSDEDKRSIKFANNLR